MTSRNYEVRGPKFCVQVAAGRSVESICRDKGMPKLSTVQGWIERKPDFRRRLAGARRLRAERLTMEVIAIAEALSAQPSAAEARGARLRMDACKWTVAQLLTVDFEAEGDVAALLPPPRFKEKPPREAAAKAATGEAQDGQEAD